MGIVDPRVCMPGRGIADTAKPEAGLQVFFQHRSDAVAERQVGKADDACRDLGFFFFLLTGPPGG